MALLFMDGFDAGSDSERWACAGTGFASLTTTRFGAGRCLGIDDNTTMKKTFSQADKILLGFAFNPNNTYNISSKSLLRILGDSGATSHISLSIPSRGQLSLWRGANSTLLESITIPTSGWLYLEVAATISDTVGSINVRLNGQSVIDFTGDTKNGGTNTTVDTVIISGGIFGAYMLFDDLYICDDTGTTNNTFLGDVRVQTLVPNAAGTSTDFTPTGGANYANVAEIPDNVATYNSSTTVGHKDTYGFGDLVSGTDTVFGIQTNMRAKKADAGLGALKEIVVAGSTTYDGNTTQLPTSTAWIGQIRETNPDTSAAWTVGDVNSLEAGAEVA